MSSLEFKVVNLTQKPLEQFEPGDSLFIQKLKSDFMYTLLCKFVDLRRGIVTAEVVSVSPDYGQLTWPSGVIITARKDRCYLWGPDKYGQNRCQWYRKGGWGMT